MATRFLSLALALLLAGCGGVFSKHPASDDESSRLDERLVGFWRVDAASKADLDELVLVIGKKAGSERALELVAVGLQGDRTIKTSRAEFYATTIASKDWASVLLPREREERSDPVWGVVRYELADADTLRVVALDETKVAADVRASKVVGEVVDGVGAGATPTVTLDVPIGVLRAWLEARADAVVRGDEPLVLKRLKVR